MNIFVLMTLIGYALAATFFVIDVYLSSPTETIQDKILHYGFALLWPVGVLLGIILFGLDFLKNRLQK